MDLLLILALILNLIIIGCEIVIFIKINKKIDIVKYYSFYQNFLALIISIIFCFYLVIFMFYDSDVIDIMRGLRYIETTGLVSLMIIYGIFLSSKDKNLLKDSDFKLGLSAKAANFILHYFCPIISFVSFVFFEREIVLNEMNWTWYVAIPTCIYWGGYIFLSVTKLWEEPYDFSIYRGERKNIFLEILEVLVIPLLFVFISFILWLVK